MALKNFTIPTFTTTAYLTLDHFSVESVRLAASKIAGVEYHALPNAFIVTKDNPDLEAYMHSHIWRWQCYKLRTCETEIELAKYLREGGLTYMEQTNMLDSIQDYLVDDDDDCDRREMAAIDLIKRLEPNRCLTDAELLASLSDLEGTKIAAEMNEIDYGKGLLSKYVTRVFDDTFIKYPADSDSE